MAKNKKKKKDKRGKAGGISAITKSGAKAAQRLKTLSQNPFLADVVAAALVGAAAALKDSKKARQLASEAGDELEAMSRKGMQRGEALWDMALDIGRRSVEALSAEAAPKRAKSKPTAKVAPKPAAKPSPPKRQAARKNSR